MSFNALQTGALQLGAARLPICPVGPAIVSKRAGGPVLASARFSGPVLDGRLGKSPLHLAAAGGQIVGKQFAMDRLDCGSASRPRRSLFDATRLTGSFVGSGVRGAFDGAKATIGKVPLLLSDASGKWLVHHGDLSIDAST